MAQSYLPQVVVSRSSLSEQLNRPGEKKSLWAIRLGSGIDPRDHRRPYQLELSSSGNRACDSDFCAFFAIKNTIFGGEFSTTWWNGTFS